MIRREDADGVRLITQHDHALLSGELARHIGNARFAKLTRGESSVQGIALHDCGWPLHDDMPTIKPDGRPLDVFESTPEVALPVWSTSAERAAERDPYAGLLVSLHVLALSFIAVAHNGQTFSTDAHKKFQMNKFQHREIERQETLRQALGLRIDRPLKHGLAEEGIDPAEDALRFDFRMLQAMDRVSLAVCCTQLPLGHTVELHARPGERTSSINIATSGRHAVRVAPWPFDRSKFALQVNARRLDRIHFADDADLRAAYAAAAVERLEFSVHS